MHLHPAHPPRQNGRWRKGTLRVDAQAHVCPPRPPCLPRRWRCHIPSRRSPRTPVPTSAACFALETLAWRHLGPTPPFRPLSSAFRGKSILARRGRGGAPPTRLLAQQPRHWPVSTFVLVSATNYVSTALLARRHAGIPDSSPQGIETCASPRMAPAEVAAAGAVAVVGPG